MRCAYCNRPTPEPDERPGSRYTSTGHVVCERNRCFERYAIREARAAGYAPEPKSREERAMEDENQLDMGALA